MRSAVKSNLTAWCNQILSNRALSALRSSFQVLNNFAIVDPTQPNPTHGLTQPMENSASPREVRANRLNSREQWRWRKRRTRRRLQSFVAESWRRAISCTPLAHPLTALASGRVPHSAQIDPYTENPDFINFKHF